MAAIAWLVNLGFAAGTASAAPAGVIQLVTLQSQSYTLP